MSGSASIIVAPNAPAISHVQTLFINTQREIQQTGKGLSTADRNVPYLCVSEMLALSKQRCDEQVACGLPDCEHWVHHVVPLYSPKVYSRITFLPAVAETANADVPVSNSLVLHLFGSRDAPPGSYHTGFVVFGAEPADDTFYGDLCALAFNILHAGSLVFIADLPMNVRFTSSQLSEKFCVRSFLGQLPGIKEMEDYQKLSPQELHDTFLDLEEFIIAAIVSQRQQLPEEQRSKVSLVLTYVPTVDTFLDETYISGIGPFIRQLANTLLTRVPATRTKEWQTN